LVQVALAQLDVVALSAYKAIFRSETWIALLVPLKEMFQALLHRPSPWFRFHDKH